MSNIEGTIISNSNMEPNTTNELPTDLGNKIYNQICQSPSDFSDKQISDALGESSSEHECEQLSKPQKILTNMLHDIENKIKNNRDSDDCELDELSFALPKWEDNVDEINIKVIEKEKETENDLVIKKNQCEIKEKKKYNNALIKTYAIDTIFTSDINNAESNKIISWNYIVSKFTLKIIKDQDLKKQIDKKKIESIKYYLEYISKFNQILSTRISQSLLKYDFDVNNPIIARSSYKFCSAGAQCKKFYNKHKNPTCKYHHYVHSILKYDVDSVICFLDHSLSNNIILNTEILENIFTSLKTIKYVSKHMKKEMMEIIDVTCNELIFYHRNNPYNQYIKNFKIMKNRNKYNNACAYTNNRTNTSNIKITNKFSNLVIE
jgi:hypothetical protein